jgi:hypothetical protein
MKRSILFIAAGLLSLASCRTENKHTVDSFEIPTMKCSWDTINMVANGLKQGVWINHTSHDTTVYLNDTAHSVTPPMTAMEMILQLRKDGNKDYIDSLRGKAH